MNANEEKIMTKEELADRIAERVYKYDWVSQGELINCCGASLRGDMLLKLGASNIVLFVGCSELFLDALEVLRTEITSRVKLAPASMLVMMCDGCPIPNMPLAKRPPVGGYKKEHYIPTCFVRPETEANLGSETR